jgi:Flp pilus assembly protein TadG
MTRRRNPVAPARRKRLRGEDGQALVEFAFILPLFMLVVIGTIQFGFVLHNYVTLTDAVRAGARQAAVSRGTPDPVASATSRVRKSAVGLKQSKLAVTVTPHDPLTGTATWVQGGDVTVEAKYPFNISVLGIVVHRGELNSKTTERVE